MSCCSGCGASTGTDDPCERCVAQAVTGLRRLQAAREQLAVRWPWVRPLTAPLPVPLAVRSELRLLRAVRLLLLPCSGVLVAAHAWWWQRVFRMSCAQRMGVELAGVILLGTVIGLRAGAACGRYGAETRLKELIAVPEGATLRSHLAASWQRQAGGIGRLLAWMTLPLGAVLSVPLLAGRVTGWQSDVAGLVILMIMQALFSFMAGAVYGVFASSRWIEACLRHANRQAA